MRDADLWLEFMLATMAAGHSPKAKAWREPYWPRRVSCLGLGGGLQRIIPDADGTYCPTDHGGMPAIIAPVWEGSGPGHEDELIDLAAWVPTHNLIFTRLGIAEVLGEHAVFSAEHPLSDRPEPLRVYPAPGAWARDARRHTRGAHGVVVIDWSAAWRRLGHLTTVVATDLPTARKLRDALQPPPAPLPPRILVAAAAAERGVA